MKFKIPIAGLEGESLKFAAQLNDAFEKIPEGLSREDMNAEIKKSFASFFDEKGEMVFDAKSYKETLASTKKSLEDLQTEFAEYKKANGRLRPKGLPQQKSFFEAWCEAVDNNMDKFKAGRPFSLELKGITDMNFKAAAQDMTNSTFGGGSSIALPTIRPDAILKPGYPVQFRDIVDVVPSATGLYWQHAESSSDGGFGTQTEGASKNQVDYVFAREIVQANYIQAYSRVTRQLLQDNSYLQQALPKLLLRDFFIAESQTFYASLISLISNSTATGTNRFDQVTNAIAALEELNFTPNLVLAKPSDYSQMITLKSTGSGEYLKPGNLTFDKDGALTFNGILPVKANFLTKGNALLGDFNYAHIVQSEDISIRFFEQDANNVTQNKITILCEAREGLAVDLSSAFANIAFTS